MCGLEAGRVRGMVRVSLAFLGGGRVLPYMVESYRILQSQHPKQNYLSSKVNGRSESWEGLTPLGAPVCNWKRKSPISTGPVWVFGASSLGNLFCSDVRPCPSSSHIIIQASSHFRLMPVSLQETSRTWIFKGRRVAC